MDEFLQGIDSIIFATHFYCFNIHTLISLPKVLHGNSTFFEGSTMIKEKKNRQLTDPKTR